MRFNKIFKPKLVLHIERILNTCIVAELTYIPLLCSSKESMYCMAYTQPKDL